MSKNILRFPAGYSADIAGTVRIDQFQRMAKVHGLTFGVEVPAVLSTFRQRRLRKPDWEIERAGPGAQAFDVFNALSPQERIEFLLTEPAGISIIYLGVKEEPSSTLDPLLAEWIPDPSRHQPTTSADGRYRSGWDAAFEDYARSVALRHGWDLDAIRKWYVEMPLGALAEAPRPSYLLQAQTSSFTELDHMSATQHVVGSMKPFMDDITVASPSARPTRRELADWRLGIGLQFGTRVIADIEMIGLDEDPNPTRSRFPRLLVGVGDVVILHDLASAGATELLAARRNRDNSLELVSGGPVYSKAEIGVESLRLAHEAERQGASLSFAAADVLEAVLAQADMQLSTLAQDRTTFGR